MKFKRIVCGIMLCLTMLMLVSCSASVKVSGNKLIPDGTIKSVTVILTEGQEENKRYNCNSEQIKNIVDAINVIEYVEEDPGIISCGSWCIILHYSDDSETVIVLQAPYLRINSQNTETRSLRTQNNSAEQLCALLEQLEH